MRAQAAKLLKGRQNSCLLKSLQDAGGKQAKSKPGPPNLILEVNGEPSNHRILMAKILCVDTEPSTAQSIQAAGHEVATGELGYRTGVPSLSTPPHEVDAIVCDLKLPACYDSVDWGPGRNDNYRCKIVKSIPFLAQVLDGGSKPRYRIIEETQLAKSARGMFGPKDLLRAVGAAGVPIFFFLNPEWLRHVAFESPNIFGIRWRFNPTKATKFSVAKPLAKLLAKFDGPVKFRTPVHYEITQPPRFVEKPTFAQWFPLLTNPVNQVFGQILQVGKGYIWSIPTCHDNERSSGKPWRGCGNSKRVALLRRLKNYIVFPAGLQPLVRHVQVHFRLTLPSPIC